MVGLAGAVVAFLAGSADRAAGRGGGVFYDNEMCEGFFASLECELIDRRVFKTHAEARMAVFQYIGGWCNLRRTPFHARLSIADQLRKEALGGRLTHAAATAPRNGVNSKSVAGPSAPRPRSPSSLGAEAYLDVREACVVMDREG